MWVYGGGAIKVSCGGDGGRAMEVVRVGRCGLEGAGASAGKEVATLRERSPCSCEPRRLIFGHRNLSAEPSDDS